MKYFNIITLLLYLLIIGTACSTGKKTKNNTVKDTFKANVEIIYSSKDSLFLQARSAIIPQKSDTGFIITQSIYGYGTHAYGDLYMMKKPTREAEWSSPEKIESLTRQTISSEYVKAFGDVTPAWHKNTQTVLSTGKSFFARTQNTGESPGNTKRVDIENMQEIAYAIYYPNQDKWSNLKSIALPAKLDNGDDFVEANAGCTQRVDLPNGDVLLPIRYKKNGFYVSTVIKCTYDGQELKYQKHGSLLTIEQGRGLYEPSLCKYGDTFYLTLRANKSAYVAKSSDGLNFSDFKEWTFSDGTVLGSYNTQQHWISNPHGLFLVYTRKGANNDHIFRHRAPLFIAQVDPENLSVFKDTEKIIIPIPSNGGDVGNFGVTHVNENESWVTAPVSPKDSRSKDRETIVIVAKIKW